MEPAGMLHGFQPALPRPVDSAPRGRLFGFEESPAANLRTGRGYMSTSANDRSPSRARPPFRTWFRGHRASPEIDFVQNPSAGASNMKRSLAIEELGTSFQVEKRVPLVRLKGHWLKASLHCWQARHGDLPFAGRHGVACGDGIPATLNLILGGAPEGKPDLPRAVPDGSRAGVRGLAEAPTGSAVPAELPPDLTVPAGSRLAASAVPNGTRWVIRRVFPSATAGLPLASPPGKSASHRNRLPIPVVRPRTSPPNRESMKTTA